MPGKSLFFSARKPRHKLSAVGTPMNLQASLSKLNKHKRRDLLGCSLCHCKACTCLFKTKSGGEGPGVIRVLMPHHWHPSPKPHDGGIWEVSLFPENTWCSSPEKGKQIYSFCEHGTICSHKWQKKPFLLFSLATQAGGSVLHAFSKGSLSVLIPPACLSPVKSMPLHRCH